MFNKVLDGNNIIRYKLYPKPENEIEWMKEVCPKCPYYYKNYENSYEYFGTPLAIRKKCIFNKDN